MPSLPVLQAKTPLLERQTPKTLNLNIALFSVDKDFSSLVLLVDNMKLAEKLEIDELVAHLEAPENSDLLANV